MDSTDNTVEAFVVLASNARGGAAADLINKATSDPKVFNFGELLECKSIDALRGSEHDAAYRLLELFCFGTWKEYQSSHASLPPLNEAQIRKLKQLTVVSLAEANKGSGQGLMYTELHAALDLPEVRQLEEFIVHQCIYPGLLQAQLDSQHRRVVLLKRRVRDVKKEEVGMMREEVARWMGNIGDIIKAVEGQVADLVETGKRRKQAEQSQGAGGGVTLQVASLLELTAAKHEGEQRG